jgi:glycosyltransferase involved in cell wall biosynthesis
MPTLSVIIPCYNAERYLAQTIESVLRQTFTDWELIIVDDGSTDNSPSIIRSFVERDPRIGAVRKENGGVSSARNLGYKRSSHDSRYIQFLDSDDVLLEAMYARTLAYLDQHSNVGLAFVERNYIDGAGRRIRTQWGSTDRWLPGKFLPQRIPDDVPETPFTALFLIGAIIPSAAIHRRAVYDQSPGWDESFGQPYEDTDLHQNIAMISTVHYIPETLMSYRIHSTQSTASNERMRTQRAKLMAKWRSRLDSLPPDQQDSIRRAMAFHRAAIPRWRIRWGLQEISRGNPKGATLHFLRAGKALVTGKVGDEAVRTYGSHIP